MSINALHTTVQYKLGKCISCSVELVMVSTKTALGV